MAAYKLWSDEKKQYIQSLIPKKKILFANINSATKAQWNEVYSDNDYDVILGYYEQYDVYIACNAKYHVGNKNASFDCMSNYLSSKEIKVGYRLQADNRTEKERVVLIPCRKLEEFCRHADFYLERYEPEK